MVNKNKNGRTLIYTCADKGYAHWIPLYCLGMLYHNSDIDIEIGIEGSLCEEDHQAVEYLKSKFPESIIKINENLFVRDGNYAIIDGKKCFFNTVRFITTPTIIDEYLYIGDIDIICLENDIFSKHISFMKKKNMCYSNMVRKNISRLTGLHFSIYNKYYPLPSLENIDMMKNDEEILTEIVMRKGIEINFDSSWRPTHGIHFSKNRTVVRGDSKTPGWNADAYMKKWSEFINSEEFMFIIDNSNTHVKEMINKLHKAYENEFDLPKPYKTPDCLYYDNMKSDTSSSYYINPINGTQKTHEEGKLKITCGNNNGRNFIELRTPNIPLDTLKGKSWKFECDISGLNNKRIQLEILEIVNDTQNQIGYSGFSSVDGTFSCSSNSVSEDATLVRFLVSPYTGWIEGDTYYIKNFKIYLI